MQQRTEEERQELLRKLLEKAHAKAKEKELAKKKDKPVAVVRSTKKLTSAVQNGLEKSAETAQPELSHKNTQFIQSRSSGKKRKQRLETEETELNNVGASEETEKEEGKDKKKRYSEDLELSSEKERRKKKKKQIKEALEAEKSEIAKKLAEKTERDPVESDVIRGSAYPILGPDSFESPKQLEVVRPKWIQKSTSVSAKLNADMTPVIRGIPDVDADLFSEIFEREGVKHWFPVQKEVIPELIRDFRIPRNLPRRDLCIAAPTGSGKTLCYVLPIVQELSDRVEPKIRVLIMLPVKDLAQQVFRVFSTYAEKTNLTISLLTGQKDFESEQKSLRDQAPDILIATPGRLIDHLWANQGTGNGSNLGEQENVDLRFLRYLVIDEADRMMTDCRFDWLSEVERAVYGGEVLNEFRSKPASLAVRRLREVRIPMRRILLSATLSDDPEQLQQWNLFQPKLFTSASRFNQSGNSSMTSLGVPAELNQYHVICAGNMKPLNLHIILENHAQDWKKVLCFVGSKENGRRLTGILKLMNAGGIVAEIDGKLLRRRREKVLKQFASGKIRVLVCSDLVARGMDIPDIDCVISYNSPRFLKTYVHRVGRTARAGRSGTAVTILEKEEVEKFKELLSPVCDWSVIQEMRISEEKVAELKVEYKSALKQLKTQIQSGKREVKKRRYNNRKR